MSDKQMAQDRELLERADIYCEALFTEEPPTAVLLVNELRVALARRLTDAEQAQWQPIETAPEDGSLFLVYAPGREGLPPLMSLCAWHPDAGFCIDELREPTHWMPLPAAPTGETEVPRQTRGGPTMTDWHAWRTA